MANEQAAAVVSPLNLPGRSADQGHLVAVLLLTAIGDECPAFVAKIGPCELPLVRKREGRGLQSSRSNTLLSNEAGSRDKENRAVFDQNTRETGAHASLHAQVTAKHSVAVGTPGRVQFRASCPQMWFFCLSCVTPRPEPLIGSDSIGFPRWGRCRFRGMSNKGLLSAIVSISPYFIFESF
ncbi:hypothetical protein VTI74DRAFT_6871 [Chaetomium olivicolor]